MFAMDIKQLEWSLIIPVIVIRRVDTIIFQAKLFLTILFTVRWYKWNVTWLSRAIMAGSSSDGWVNWAGLITYQLWSISELHSILSWQQHSQHHPIIIIKEIISSAEHYVSIKSSSDIISDQRQSSLSLHYNGGHRSLSRCQIRNVSVDDPAPSSPGLLSSSCLLASLGQPPVKSVRGAALVSWPQLHHVSMRARWEQWNILTQVWRVRNSWDNNWTKISFCQFE